MRYIILLVDIIFSIQYNNEYYFGPFEPIVVRRDAFDRSIDPWCIISFACPF